MKYKIKILFLLTILIQSCWSDKGAPNYEYMPNMYKSLSYESYSENDLFDDNLSARLPVEGTIPRGYSLYDYEDTNEGYEDAKVSLKSPIEISEVNLSNGKELYGIYCAVCHGSKGDGQGILMTREKFLGIPSYKDREITPGSIYHVLMYGKNAMGSHAGQVNEIERWQIAQHVMQLRSNLIKK